MSGKVSIRVQLGDEIGRVEVDDLEDLWLEVIDLSGGAKVHRGVVPLTVSQAREVAEGLLVAARDREARGEV